MIKKIYNKIRSFFFQIFWGLKSADKIEFVNTEDKQQLIIVYCSSGYRSKKVQKKLENIGYKKVYNLYNGLSNY